MSRRRTQDPTQPQLFDLPEGLRRREEGMARVLAHTDSEWRDHFIRAALDLMRQNGRIHADAVIAVAGKPPAGVNPNSVGAIVNGLAKSEKWFAVGTHLSRQPSRHGGRQTIWASRYSS